MVLIFFEAITSLRVIVGKSEIVPVGEVGNLNVLAHVLCCRVGNLPMTYLSMLLWAHYKDSSTWNLIIEKMERRLSGWKHLAHSLPRKSNKRNHDNLLQVISSTKNSKDLDSIKKKTEPPITIENMNDAKKKKKSMTNLR